MLEAIFGGMEGMLQQPMLWLFFLLFFLFIIVAYKAVKVLVRALVVAVIAGLFPVFANMFLGMSIPITLSNIIWFAMVGVEIYFVYHILVGVGTIAEFITKPFSKGKTKTVEKVIIVEKGKDKDEKEKREDKEGS
jgi:hypothetical protein